MDEPDDADDELALSLLGYRAPSVPVPPAPPEAPVAREPASLPTPESTSAGVTAWRGRRADDSIVRYLPTAGAFPVDLQRLLPDDGTGELPITARARSTVFSVVAGVVSRTDEGCAIDGTDGRRYELSPVTVTATDGTCVPAGVPIGQIGDGSTTLVLSVADSKGAALDPYPLLIGARDVLEVGVAGAMDDDPDDIDFDAPRRRPAPDVAASDDERSSDVYSLLVIEGES